MLTSERLNQIRAYIRDNGILSGTITMNVRIESSIPSLSSLEFFEGDPEILEESYIDGDYLYTGIADIEAEDRKTIRKKVNVTGVLDIMVITRTLFNTPGGIGIETSVAIFSENGEVLIIDVNNPYVAPADKMCISYIGERNEYGSVFLPV